MKTVIFIAIFCAATCFAQTPEATKAAAQPEQSTSPATGSEQEPGNTAAQPEQSTSPAKAFGKAAGKKNITAELEARSGSKVTGFVVFTQVGDQVQVTGAIQRLTPGKHGLHIHENGDCSAPDAASAGAHFNPTHQHHGGPTTKQHHVGDLGNVEANASGYARLNWTGKLSLSGDDSIIGKSLVVHEKEDDLKTDPSGNSGARVACGVIKER